MVPVADGQPGEELQVDYGGRALWALIFTPVVSRHTFVWCSWRQSIEDVIAGCESAWDFYDGVFKVLIPDNLKAIVDQAMRPTRDQPDVRSSALVMREAVRVAGSELFGRADMHDRCGARGQVRALASR